MNNILNNKKIIILYIVIFVITTILSYLFFIIFMNTDDILLKKELTCNFREKIHVNDFIDMLDGTLIKNPLIDTSEVGIKTAYIHYKNRYGLVVKKKFKIEVLDITDPTIVVSNPYVVEIGSNIKLEEKIFCADDYDDYVDCKISGEYNLNKIGNYNLEISATDFSGNTTSKEFTLKVVEKNDINNKTTTNNSFTSYSNVYKKYKKYNTKIGLDISKWQEDVDFEKLKSAGVEFIMLKIGGQTEINGSYAEDPKFRDNIEKAIQNDIDVGVYFYSYANNEKEARKEARWIIQKLKNYSINLPIAFDWENWDEFSTFHISFHTLNKVAKAFISEVEKYGYRGILYSSKHYLENIWYEDDYTKWLAYYTNNNDYKNKYLLWQLCNDGKIEGINGYVDIDIMYK